MKPRLKLFTAYSLSLTLFACGRSEKPKNPEEYLQRKSEPTTITPAVDLQSHMIFDSKVPSSQKGALQKTLAHIERFTLEDALPQEQEKLSALLEIPDLSPGSLSNWLKLRIRYILHADTSLYRIAVVDAANQNLYAGYLTDQRSEANLAATMTGTTLFALGSKLRQEEPTVSYLAIEVNNSWVHANTLRNGVMQIGPALFASEFQINPLEVDAYSNIALRTETLFHEARHADGNSADQSLGFVHGECPSTDEIASEFWGQNACDFNQNGPYTVGAEIMRAYLAKCGGKCSTVERTIMEAAILDSLSRVASDRNNLLPSLVSTPEADFPLVDISNFQIIPTKL